MIWIHEGRKQEKYGKGSKESELDKLIRLKRKKKERLSEKKQEKQSWNVTTEIFWTNIKGSLHHHEGALPESSLTFENWQIALPKTAGKKEWKENVR